MFGDPRAHGFRVAQRPAPDAHVPEGGAHGIREPLGGLCQRPALACRNGVDLGAPRGQGAPAKFLTQLLVRAHPKFAGRREPDFAQNRLTPGRVQLLPSRIGGQTRGRGVHVRAESVAEPAQRRAQGVRKMGHAVTHVVGLVEQGTLIADCAELLTDLDSNIVKLPLGMPVQRGGQLPGADAVGGSLAEHAPSPH